MQRASPDMAHHAPRYDLEGSGFGFVTERRFEIAQTTSRHACSMARPGYPGVLDVHDRGAAPARGH